jgi:predicted ThiF/HesA family dinucleotide-utilizing enzyme
MATLLAQYSQTSFQIRAIRGSILKVSLGIVTENVAVNIDPSVTSTLSYTTVVSTTVAPTTTVPTTTTTKHPVATLIASNTISNGAVFGIVFGGF